MHCRGLMAISTRKAGSVVECATCGEKTLVPHVDIFTREAPVGDSPDATEFPPFPAAEFPADGEDGEDGEEANLPDPPPAAMEPSPDERSDGEDQPLEQEPFVPADVENDDGQPLTLRRPKGDEEMDLTPMVDVTFQLLIFFMVSASFSLQKTIEVPTPDPDQKGATQQVQTMDDLQGTSILVRIDAGNAISIDDEPLADVSRLTDTLRDKMRREQKTELLLTAHSQSLHRTVIAVIDAANEIGVQKIRMSSQKKMD